MADLLTLPANHTAEELDMARRLAEALGCGALHVFWSAAKKEAGRFQPHKRCGQDARTG